MKYVLLLLAACAAPRPATVGPYDHPRELPEGLLAACFLQPCDATGDLDADGREDRVRLVGDGMGRRGFAVEWGDPERPTLLIGAGARTASVEVDDDGGRHPGELKDDYGFLAGDDEGYVLGSWRIITRADLDAYEFLPDPRGDGLRLDGGDSVWVIYLAGDTGDLLHAPLGF